MKVFNARHFLRHVSASTLREFTEAHAVGAHLNLDWTQPQELLCGLVCDAVDALKDSLALAHRKGDPVGETERHLQLWQDDLRRAHLMSNALAMTEFRGACHNDVDALAVFSTRDERECALWMLAFRSEVFRNAEHYLAFQAKTNGKYWKKHRVHPGLQLSKEREHLDAFCHEVAKLYEREGAGQGVHIDVSERSADASVQLTLYVEGPVTALAHFTESTFSRITTRIALETAIVYHPDSGDVETIVKGGAKNHAAVLELFGKHVAQASITPQEVERKRYRLNALRDGLDPCEDWSAYDIEAVRLRRARFSPVGRTGVSLLVEASPERGQDDALGVARGLLKVEHAFEVEYDMTAATLVVYLKEGGRSSQFSFGVMASGSSTIKNLSERNQRIAYAILQALDVMEGGEQVRGPAEA